MIDHSSTKRFESKVLPGVAFVIRVFSDGVRNRMNLNLADVLDEIRTLQTKLRIMNIENEAELEPGQLAEVTALLERAELIKSSKVDPEYFKAGFVGVEGLRINGKIDLTADQFRELGPPDLYDEIVAVVRLEAGLSKEERLNLLLPITSGAEADGQGSNTTAPIA